MSNATKSTRSATHYGTCQICGSRQKASRNPEGTQQWVAKHGYRLEWHTQLGSCHGSNREPLETSCEYAKAVAARLVKAVAEYVEQPRPENVGTAWKPSPELTKWRNARLSHDGNKQLLRHLQGVIASWVPRQQVEVREFDAAEAAQKTVRRGLRELSRALADAKRQLSKHGEKFAAAIEAEVNAPLYAERNAWYAAHPNECFPRHADFFHFGYFTVATVKKIQAYLKTLANPSSSLVEGGQVLAELDAAYKQAKAAYEACKEA